jgi:hypothetical protein
MISSLKEEPNTHDIKVVDYVHYNYYIDETHFKTKCSKCNQSLTYNIDQYYDSHNHIIKGAFCHYCKDFGFLHPKSIATGRPVCGDHCVFVVRGGPSRDLPMSCCLDCLPYILSFEDTATGTPEQYSIYTETHKFTTHKIH